MNKSSRISKNFIVAFVVSLFVIMMIYLLGNLLYSDKTEIDYPIHKQANNEYYKVVRVIDGDTVIVRIEGEDKIVRLIGINTPEIVDPYRPIECFGKESSDKAKEILTNETVRLERDNLVDDTDKYGRFLRYIFLNHGTNFGKIMIEEGYAFEYTYNDGEYKYQKEYQLAEKEAKENQRGLWADGICNE